MRIDQYLWFVRIFRSRNMASNACKAGKIKINDQIVKPSREALPLDIVQVRKEQLWRSYKITDLPLSRLSAKLVGLYQTEITDISMINHQELKGLSAKVIRDEGTGRPTKKQRREIDEIQLDEKFDN
ncbi:S4 domain-containing protein [Flavobacteriaceae bacterium]|jgi:ribosome-associated heat shock protein Hsp15|nr:S4 domain-containing protein [Flavobacteriaceae bacterium]|tara:strand:- start:1166 stop:1546 length:381 start_codon:yes stop_codon:yes gene_type:complete